VPHGEAITALPLPAMRDRIECKGPPHQHLRHVGSRRAPHLRRPYQHAPGWKAAAMAAAAASQRSRSSAQLSACNCVGAPSAAHSTAGASGRGARGLCSAACAMLRRAPGQRHKHVCTRGGGGAEPRVARRPASHTCTRTHATTHHPPIPGSQRAASQVCCVQVR
jgi:hypothetical protein